MKKVEQQVQQQYQFVEQIGVGTFGHIISVKSRSNGKVYACKIQKNHGKKTILVQKQYRILSELVNNQHFLRVYSLKKLDKNSYMIMQKMDRNLQVLLKQNNKPFDIKTIAMIANKLVTALYYIHKLGYLHRDLKPENIMNAIDSHQIKIIDFGLADYLNVNRSSAIIGNVRYASRGAHLGYSSKSDDLQSLIYVLYYLMLGSLPWSSCSRSEVQREIQRTIQNGDSIKMTVILQMKYNFLNNIREPKTSNLIKSSFYEEIHLLAANIMNLKSDQEPNYNEIIHKTQRLMMIAGVNKDSCFWWCPNKCPNKKTISDYFNIFS